jgi:hypothetical protein
MTLPERIAELGTNIIGAALLAIGGGIGWLVRRVLTNQAEIAMLKQHLESRDELRREDREALGDVRDSVKRIEGWIMERGK